MALAGALLSVQLASDAIFSRSAVSASLPAALPMQWGVAIYGAIDDIAPARYAEEMLADAALERHDLEHAQSYALALPASPARDELLGKIAQARGDEALAQRFFISSADVFAFLNEVNRLAKHDPLGAYDLELQMRDRLAQSATHPDALADTYWRLGRLATRIGYSHPSRRMQWFETGMHDYINAVALAPLSEKYLIAAGSQALNLSDPAQAKTYFARAANQNPASADAYAGLGVSAFKQGDLSSARAYYALARAYDPRSHFVHTLQALIQ